MFAATELISKLAVSPETGPTGMKIMTKSPGKVQKWSQKVLIFASMVLFEEALRRSQIPDPVLVPLQLRVLIMIFLKGGGGH